MNTSSGEAVNHHARARLATGLARISSTDTPAG